MRFAIQGGRAYEIAGFLLCYPQAARALAGPATRLSGMYHPRGQLFFGMRLPLWLQRRKRRAAFGKIRQWLPERILLSHGRCFEENTDEVLRRLIRPD